MLRSIFTKVAAARVKNPKAGNVSLFMNENGEPRLKKSDGTVVPLVETPEVPEIPAGKFHKIIGVINYTGANPLASSLTVLNSDDPDYYGNVNIALDNIGQLKITFSHSVTNAIVMVESGHAELGQTYNAFKISNSVYITCKNSSNQYANSFINVGFTFMIRKDAH